MAYVLALDDIKQRIHKLSESERLELREWLAVNAVDLASSADLNQLFNLAVECLGSADAARRWLQEPNMALAGEMPVFYARNSREQLDYVKNMLRRIQQDEYGSA